MLLIFVLILMAIFMLYLILRYPQIPLSWLWPVVWGGMGIVLLTLSGIYFWWDGVLKDREEFNRL